MSTGTEMNLGTDIYQALLKAQEIQHTGRIYIFPSGVTARPAELDMIDGEIAAIRYANDTGILALTRLIEQSITKILLVPGNRQKTEPTPDTPTLDAVFN